MKRHIPNLITLLNLFCGCIAIVFIAIDHLELAAAFVFLGIIFDFFDGLAARALDVRSELGLQLDSLADMVTSGVAPGFVMFQLLNKVNAWNLDSNTSIDFTHSLEIHSFLPFLGFIITLGSAYRLAKFNIDEEQTSSFIGIPTPANTLLIFSLPLILIYQPSDLAESIILNQWFLLGMTVLSAFLMNARIRLFALKFKNWKLKGNETRYLFLLLCIIGLALLKFIAIPLIIVLYIVLSLVRNPDKT
ncbi:phosphatidylserine synthase [Leptobacterium flavescens]|uniref:Phosphatidylserine synthase n=1 Tax=Leptobacterium flavescens TaxID=472055 RepID=A0A6P0UJV9_9FLAO|nr:CDP-alcohol phosphatidyltransferase family protein [Leptobacterium flavescens]NER12159.1 phosphatidylserine synthase [Leptobacterium flavescens]